MSKSCAIGIDQGTTGTKACLLDYHGKLLFTCAVPVALVSKSADEIEQDPEELLQSIKSVIVTCKQHAEGADLNISAIGLTCQRSGVCAWEKSTGKAVHNLIHWSDTRFRNITDSLSHKDQEIFRETGVPLTPHYAAPKISYLQNIFPNQEILIGTLDSYLVYNLLDEKLFITDDSMAARTMLYNVERGEWNQKLCEIFNVNKDRLARIVNSVGRIGDIERQPLLAMVGDQQAALYSSSLYGNKCLLNLGSIASFSILSGLDRLTEQGFVSSVLYSESDANNGRLRHYLLEAVTNSCGIIIKKIMSQVAAAESIDQINKALSNIRDDEFSDVIFSVPNGSASPLWKYKVPDLYETDRKIEGWNYARALIENIGNLICYSIEILRKKFPQLFDQVSIPVSGGVSSIDYLCQYISNVLNLPLKKSEQEYMTVQGAALLALRVIGINEKAFSFQSTIVEISPRDSEARKRYEKWLLLMNKALG